MKNRLLSLLLAMVVVFSLLPASALAAEEEDPESTPEATSEPIPETTEDPTPEPTEAPTPEPTEAPTPEPTEAPTPEPTEEPTPESTEEPTPEPTEAPTPEPTEEPTPEPTPEATAEPTAGPTATPTPTPAPAKVRVHFVLSPETAEVKVWPAPVKGEELDETAEPIQAEEDGDYLLLPGKYLYTASCERYVTAEKKELTVEPRTEGAQKVEVKLAPAILTAKTEPAVARTEADGAVVASGTCGDNVTWTLDGNGLLTISGSGTMDDQTTFQSPWLDLRDSIRTVKIGSGVTRIGEHSFYKFANLSSVTIPSSVTAIGGWAFEKCPKLSSVTIPEGVTSIGYCGFDDCTGLKSITIPSSMTVIDQYAFLGCSSLATVMFLGSQAQWNAIDIRYGNTELTDAEIHFGFVASGTCGYDGDNLTWRLYEDGLLAISGSGAMNNYSSSNSPWYSRRGSIQTVVIESGVTSIGTYAFYYCTAMTSVLIPASVTDIGYDAFEGCSSLTGITIPDSVTTIGSFAFCDCSALTSVTIPDNVTTIESETFSDCSNLTSVTIPEGVTNIYESAFSGCSALSDVWYGGSQVQWNAIFIGDFNDPLTLATVHFKNFDAPVLSSVTNVAGGVKISWGAVDGAAKYRVFRKTEGGGWKKLADTAGTAYTDKSGTVGTKYFYTVRCLSAEGAYASSYDTAGKSIVFYTLATPALPTAANVAGGVKLSWTAVSGAEKYRVFRKTEGGGWAKLGDTTGTSYTDKTGTAGTKYFYTIRCLSADGKSYTSNYNTTGRSIVFYTLATPGLPAAANVTGGVKLSWTAVSGAEKYRVFRKTEGSSWKKVGDTTGTTYTDKTGTVGTRYFYTIRCVSSDGTSFTSAYDATGKGIVFYTLATPGLPTAVNVTGGVKLTWTAVSGAAKYRVFRKTAGGSWAKVGDTTGTTYTDKTGTVGTRYFYTVRCLSADGKTYTSAYNTTGRSIVFYTLATPGLPTAAKVTGGVKLTWTAVSGAAKYRVFRKTAGGSWAKVGDTTGTTYTDKTVKAGTTYYYTIRCISADGKSYTSNYNTTGRSVAY